MGLIFHQYSKQIYLIHNIVLYHFGWNYCTLGPVFQFNFANRLNRQTSCVFSHMPIYSDFFLGVFKAKACPKETRAFPLRCKTNFYLIEKSKIEISHITDAFHWEKKPTALKDLSFSNDQSIYSAILRTPWEQISQHLSKTLGLLETDSCGGREALLLPQAVADKMQGLQTHQPHSTTYEACSHCVTIIWCFYLHCSTLLVQQILPLLPLKPSRCCLQL